LSVATSPERTEPPAFDLNRAWRVHSDVALRDESFGALAYHYGTRRLHFLKSRALVTLVNALPEFDSAEAALRALIPPAEQSRYRRALVGLADSGVLDAG
jgi:putative mycofactocin binding protein MftB